MIGDPYITLEDLKDYLSLSGTERFDDVLQDAIESASDEINRFTGRQFQPAEAPTARTYDFVGCGYLPVDDFFSTEGLKIRVGADDTDPLDDNAYTLYPLNGIHEGTPGWSYNSIDLHGYWSPFRAGFQRVHVTAMWGWETVPHAVQQATRILAAETFQLKDAPLGTAGQDQYGPVLRVRDSRMATNKLKRYVRTAVYVA